MSELLQEEVVKGQLCYCGPKGRDGSDAAVTAANVKAAGAVMSVNDIEPTDGNVTIKSENIKHIDCEDTQEVTVDYELNKLFYIADTNRFDVGEIKSRIPSQASFHNQLADKNFVNSSIATNTAHYISNNGQPFTSVQQLIDYSGEVTNNDYAFITGTDEQGNSYYDRYKATVDTTTTWAKEYRLNNSSFTAAQWAAIQSGITAALVASIQSAIQGVKVNGTELAKDASKKVEIPISTYNAQTGVGTYGLVRGREATGVYVAVDGYLRLFPALQSHINVRNGGVGRDNLLPITGENLDYAVRAAMCDGTGATWTNADRLAALQRLGCVVDSSGYVRFQ